MLSWINCHILAEETSEPQRGNLTNALKPDFLFHIQTFLIHTLPFLQWLLSQYDLYVVIWISTMTRHYVQRTQKLVFQSLLKYTRSFHSQTFLHNGSLQFLCNQICLFFYRFCIAYFPLHVACKYTSRFPSKPLKKLKSLTYLGYILQSMR